MPQLTFAYAVCGTARTRYVNPRLPTPRFCSHACLHQAMRAPGIGAAVTRYTFTPAMDQAIRTAFWHKRGSLAALGRTPEFAHIPYYMLKARAKAMGLVRTEMHQVWEPEELAFCTHLWEQGVQLDALKLRMQRRGWHRSKSAIAAMMTKHQLPRRGPLLSLHQVAQGLGIDEHVVARWVRQGLLRVVPSDHLRTRLVHPRVLRRFCIRHPGEVAKGAPAIPWLIAILTDADTTNNPGVETSHGD